MNYNYTVFLKQDEGVKSLIKWQMGEHGGFFTALWKAISTADLHNQELLSKGFPLHIKAYRRYATEGGWWENLLNELRTPEVRG
jgi:hypothetical protein